MFPRPEECIDLAICVMGWDSDKVHKLETMFKEQGYPLVQYWIDRQHHETTNINGAIRHALDHSATFWHMANDSVSYPYAETIPAMVQWLREHPKTACIHPWAHGEVAEPFAVPCASYLQDGTGMTIRIELDGWICAFDEEYLGSGISELDLGEELIWRGYDVMNDRRYPVLHDRANSRQHDKKSFFMAVARRNQLIFIAKWGIVGRDRWQGVEAYNKSVPIEKRIPTFYELINMTDKDLYTFWYSVHPEHFQIRKMNGERDPNLDWLNPLIVGYSTRE